MNITIEIEPDPSFCPNHFGVPHGLIDVRLRGVGNGEDRIFNNGVGLHFTLDLRYLLT